MEDEFPDKERDDEKEGVGGKRDQAEKRKEKKQKKQTEDEVMVYSEGSEQTAVRDREEPSDGKKQERVGDIDRETKSRTGSDRVSSEVGKRNYREERKIPKTSERDEHDKVTHRWLDRQDVSGAKDSKQDQGEMDVREGDKERREEGKRRGTVNHDEQKRSDDSREEVERNIQRSDGKSREDKRESETREICVKSDRLVNGSDGEVQWHVVSSVEHDSMDEDVQRPKEQKGAMWGKVYGKRVRDKGESEEEESSVRNSLEERDEFERKGRGDSHEMGEDCVQHEINECNEGEQNKGGAEMSIKHTEEEEGEKDMSIDGKGNCILNLDWKNSDWPERKNQKPIQTGECTAGRPTDSSAALNITGDSEDKAKELFENPRLLKIEPRGGLHAPLQPPYLQKDILGKKLLPQWGRVPSEESEITQHVEAFSRHSDDAKVDFLSKFSENILDLTDLSPAEPSAVLAGTTDIVSLDVLHPFFHPWQDEKGGEREEDDNMEEENRAQAAERRHQQKVSLDMLLSDHDLEHSSRSSSSSLSKPSSPQQELLKSSNSALCCLRPETAHGRLARIMTAEVTEQDMEEEKGKKEEEGEEKRRKQEAHDKRRKEQKPREDEQKRTMRIETRKWEEQEAEREGRMRERLTTQLLREQTSDEELKENKRRQQYGEKERWRQSVETNNQIEEERVKVAQERERRLHLLQEELRREEEEEEKRMKKENEERIRALEYRLQREMKEEEDCLHKDTQTKLQQLKEQALRERETQICKLREENDARLRELHSELEAERERMEAWRWWDLDKIKAQSEEELNTERKWLQKRKEEQLASFKLKGRVGDQQRELRSPWPELQLYEYQRELSDVLQEVREEVQREHNRKLEQLKEEYRHQLQTLRHTHLEEAGDLKKRRQQLSEEEDEAEKGIEALPHLLRERESLHAELERLREDRRRERREEMEREREERRRETEVNRRMMVEKERLQSQSALLQARCDEFHRRLSELDQKESKECELERKKEEEREEKKKCKEESLRLEDLELPLSPVPASHDNHSSIDDLREYISCEGVSLQRARWFLEKQTSCLRERQAALKAAHPTLQNHTPGGSAHHFCQIIKNFKASGAVAVKKGSGHPRKSKCQDHLLNRIQLQDWVSTSAELPQDWQQADAAKKPILSKKNIKDRLTFYRKCKDWTTEDWGKVNFYDEALFRLFGTSGQMIVQRRKGEGYNESCVIPTLSCDEDERLVGDRKVTFHVTDSETSSVYGQQGTAPTLPVKVQQLAESLQQISGQLNTVLGALGSLTQRTLPFQPLSQQPRSSSYPPPPSWAWPPSPTSSSAANQNGFSHSFSHTINGVTKRHGSDLVNTHWNKLFSGVSMDTSTPYAMSAPRAYCGYTPASLSSVQSSELDGQRLQGLIEGNKRWLETRRKDPNMPLFTRYRTPPSMNGLVQLSLDDNNQIKVYHY
ncbi:hypothetical protein P4O66_017921 [Electrophorus voltai]|uniref:Uncharacterized protein n=1 Tax=Electrophorus voltai TaxID=2609070 RepID=A0AAD9DNJ2_9TELE|nr:hypothetical protein P4O66_017921 [Electrophorus voltai]